MKATEEIVNKIRKCLALANGLNATPGEMAAAMGKAKEIAMRHGIAIASINLAEGKSAAAGIEINRVDVNLRSAHPQLYHRWIYHTLMQVFGVRVIRLWSSICFIGEASDVAICKELFPWLEDVFYSTYYRVKKEGRVVSCAADKNGIYRGLSAGIIEANRREEAKLTKQESSTLAMVLVSKTALIDTRVGQEFPKLKSSTARPMKVSSDAYSVGYSKGRTIKLNQTGNGSAARGQLS